MKTKAVSHGVLPNPVSQAVTADGRHFLSALTALLPDGAVEGAGDAAAQTDAIMRKAKAILEARGGTLADICKVTTTITDRHYRKAVYDTVGRHLKGVFPCGTGLIVPSLGRPDLLVQLDIDAVAPGGPVPERLHTFSLDQWFGQPISWQGAKLVKTPHEIFVRGQTGATLDGSRMAGLGRGFADAAEQAELALANLAALLKDAGSSLDDVCKITVYVSDRAYREAVYPVIGKYLGSVYPVSTGLVVPGFARPEILFEIDAVVVPSNGKPHRRFRKYQSNTAMYGLGNQKLDCGFCMAVRSGNRVHLRGQTGMGLDEVMRGVGDVVVQTEQAMENVEVLLGEAGARLEDIVEATLFVTDSAYLTPAAAAISRSLGEVAPAFSSMVVKGLAAPELLMEVDIIAVIPEGRA